MTRYYHSDNGDWTGTDGAPYNEAINPLYRIVRKKTGRGEVDYYFAADGRLYRCLQKGQWEVFIGVEWDGEYSDDGDK